MHRRSSIKNILAVGFFGTSIYSGCTPSDDSDTRKKSIYLYKELITELAETIIPKTDTPGAKDAKVENYVIKMLIEYESPRTQNKFIIGLKDLQGISKERYGNIFQNCSLTDRIAVLEYFENKNLKIHILKKIKRKIFGDPFIYTLKNLVVTGFCTSEIGATKVLVYDHVPINYIACTPLVKEQKSWATS